MKGSLITIVLLCFTATSYVFKPADSAGVTSTASITPATLTQDLEELSRQIPTKMIMKLITRYLLNDAEFQTFVRTINSYDAFMVRMRFRAQPEIMMFESWTRSQLMLSGGSMELDDSLELDIFKMSPYWNNNVYGWQGFWNEFMSYYPHDLIRANINMKISQNGIFAQFWARLKALQPVYERVLMFPETQRLITKLQQIVDTNQLDQFIRAQFDWQNITIQTSAAIPSNTLNIPSPVYG